MLIGFIVALIGNWTHALRRMKGFKSKQKSPSSSSSVLGPPPDAPDWAVQTV